MSRLPTQAGLASMTPGNRAAILEVHRRETVEFIDHLQAGTSHWEGRTKGQALAAARAKLKRIELAETAA